MENKNKNWDQIKQHVRRTGACNERKDQTGEKRKSQETDFPSPAKDYRRRCCHCGSSHCSAKHLTVRCLRDESRSASVPVG